jgi:hypothetical protein
MKKLSAAILLAVVLSACQTQLVRVPLGEITDVPQDPLFPSVREGGPGRGRFEKAESQPRFEKLFQRRLIELLMIEY